jgi:lipoprotein signal peptidase
MPQAATSLLTPFRSPAALACFLLVAAVGLIADLGTKTATWHKLVERVEWIEGTGAIMLIRHDMAPPGQPSEYDITLIPNGLEITAVANQGAAMGLGQGRKTLFVLVSFAAILVLFYFFAQSDGRHVYQFVLGLLLAGVLGNLYDRLVHGYVRDMIHIFPGVYWSDLSNRLPNVELFPWVFNLADVFLCIGVPAVLLFGLFTRDEVVAVEDQAAPEQAGV